MRRRHVPIGSRRCFGRRGAHGVRACACRPGQRGSGRTRGSHGTPGLVERSDRALPYRAAAGPPRARTRAVAISCPETSRSRSVLGLGRRPGVAADDDEAGRPGRVGCGRHGSRPRPRTRRTDSVRATMVFVHVGRRADLQLGWVEWCPRRLRLGLAVLRFGGVPCLAGTGARGTAGVVGAVSCTAGRAGGRCPPRMRAPLCSTCRPHRGWRPS